MGNDGRTLHTETSPGVWNMSATLRKTLGDAVDAVPTASRTYPFYLNLLTPTIDAANYVDLSSLRQRGTVAFDFGRDLPFDLAFTYLREVKTGARGASAGDMLGTVTSLVDVPEPLDELTQDLGIRGAYNFKRGDVHASFNRNLFNNRVDVADRRQPLPGDRPGVFVDRRAGRSRTGALQHVARQRSHPRRVRLPAEVRAPDADRRRHGARHLDAERELPPVHDQLGDLHADGSPGQRPRRPSRSRR